MPVIKSAKKKLKQDKKRQLDNKKTKNTYKSLVKQAREHPSVKVIQEAFRMLDKAAKKNVIHENKAARLKSSLSKLLTTKKPTDTPAKKAVVKEEKPKKATKKSTKKK